MKNSFDSYISLNLKQGEATYGGKDDNTYTNMIKSFYDNVLTQGLRNIYNDIEVQSLNSLREEIKSLIAGGNFIFAEKIVKMAEHMESLTKKDEPFDSAEYLLVLEIILIEAQKLKIQIAKYCELEPFKADEIDRIQKEFKPTNNENNDPKKEGSGILIEGERRGDNCEICSHCTIF